MTLIQHQLQNSKIRMTHNLATVPQIFPYQFNINLPRPLRQERHHFPNNDLESEPRRSRLGEKSRQ